MPFYQASAEDFGMITLVLEIIGMVNTYHRDWSHQVYTFMITLCRWQVEKETSLALFQIVLSIVPATPAILENLRVTLRCSS